MGQNEENWTGPVLFLIFAIGLILTGRHYRDKKLGGQATYGQALGTGVLIALFAGLIIGTYSFIFREFIDPLDMEKMMAEGAVKLYDTGMTEQQVEHTMKTTRTMNRPIFVALGTLVGLTCFGLIVSLISSIFLKKEIKTAGNKT